MLPTGTGKTIVFASVAADQVRAGDRVLILAHRGELLEQAADKLQRSTGLVSAVEKAESTCLDSWFRVVVGSVQTLQRTARLERFPQDYFGTIIIDEAHHAITDGYRRILDYFSGAKVLGVTATPDRGDMRNLGEVFDSLAFEYKLTDAIKEGYLCKIMAQTIPLQLDITSVTMSGGDYAVGDLGTALDPYLEQIAAEMARRCKSRKTVVFLPLIKTSQKFRDLLNTYGFRAAEVNGQSDDRRQVLADFDAGKYNVLCNSMLLTEGWDCPSVDCVVVLRPTKVRSLYSQMVGRGTRLSPGKTDLLLLDFLWMTDKHELCRPADLVCEDRTVARQMTEHLAETGCPEDIEEAAAQASEDVVAQREEALAKQLEEQRRKKAKLVDPLQYEMSIQAEDLAGYVPAFGWEAGPPSEQQTAALEKLLGRELRISPTRFEKYQTCPFGYFLQYILKAAPRQKAELAPNISGTLTHWVLENALRRQGEAFKDLTPEELETLVNDLVDEYTAANLPGMTLRMEYLVGRIRRNLVGLLGFIQRDLRQSGFQPVAFELRIDDRPDADDPDAPRVDPVKLDDGAGHIVRIVGTVDRVDAMPLEKLGRTYLRVVDYKTGGKEFKLKEVYCGLDCQMLLYLFTLERNAKRQFPGATAAGVEYLLADPAPKSVDRSELGDDADPAPTYPMNGLLLDEESIYRAMDTKGTGEFVPLSFSAKTGKPLNAKSTLADSAKLGRIRDHLDGLLIDMAKNLYSGRIDAEPLCTGGRSPCTYCEFRCACTHRDGEHERTINIKDDPFAE